MQIRQIWSEQLRPEGDHAGLKEFYAVKRKGEYPGFSAILADISERIEAGYWKSGYEPSLARYFSERTWTAKIATSRQDPWAKWAKEEA